WKEMLGVEVPTPFRRMDFYESMAKYGNDKPDLRFGLEHVVLNDVIAKFGGDGGVGPMWEAVQQKDGLIKVMVVSPGSEAEQNARQLQDEMDTVNQGLESSRYKSASTPADRRELSRKETEELEVFVQGMGARGLARAKIAENGDWTQAPL